MRVGFKKRSNRLFGKLESLRKSVAIRFANADLRGADLRYADLYKADLTNANLTGARLEFATMPDSSTYKRLHPAH
jgi:uncharacterized protein YjbI with pentapeptide repeats